MGVVAAAGLAVSAIGGIMSHNEARRGRKNSERAQSEANQIARENIALQKNQLKFQKEGVAYAKEQYEDWKAVFGDVYTNLGNYYKNLTADKFIAKALREQQIAHQEAETLIRRSMAQRGIGGSDFEAYTQNMADVSNANRRAWIRAYTPDTVAQQKLGFVQLGLQGGANLLNSVNAAYGNVNRAANVVSNAHTNATNARMQQAQIFEQQRSQASAAMHKHLGNISGNLMQIGGFNAGLREIDKRLDRMESAQSSSGQNYTPAPWETKETNYLTGR